MSSRPKLRVEGHDVTTLPASGVGEGDKVKVFLGTEDAFEAVVEAVRIGNPQNGLNSISATVEEVDLEELKQNSFGTDKGADIEGDKILIIAFEDVADEEVKVQGNKKE